jgi:L-ascorbate metabolism protein UlaG (beta-lactamase superfamily)
MNVVRALLGSLARRLLPAIGGVPDPVVLTRSPQYGDGRFRNAHTPTWRPQPEDGGATLRKLLFENREQRKPSAPLPVVTRRPEAVHNGLHITWFGHASTLVEIDGARVLIDPVWSDRPSPVSFAGPKRLHPMPARLADLGRIDAVLISHDHYDHLDLATVQELVRDQDAPFVVPVGVGVHLRRWRVPAERIIELDWHDTFDIAGLSLTSTPAQHFSGRLFVRDGTLWSSWAIVGPEHSVFYSGDTGYFPGFAEVGEKYGPFDATLIQIGAYDPSWPDIHMTPEEGVATHLDVRGGLMIPVHWATFVLALHPWSDPVDRLWRESKAKDVAIAVPRPGERIDVTEPPSVDGWWQSYA